MWKTEWPKITVTVTGEGEEECCNLFHKEDWGLWLVEDYFPISLAPSCFLPSPSHQTLDGTQGPDHHRSMAPRGYRVCVCVCVRVCGCVCVCMLCASAGLEGRDPGYVVEVCSGQGPDRTWPSGGSSAGPIGQVAINQHPLSRPQSTTSNTQED